MDFSIENNKKIIDFLRNTADLIEKNEINEQNLQLAGEYYMRYLCKTEIDEVDALEEKDLVKFLTTGWYIYNIILKEKTSCCKEKR
jgi:hypothetical protein